jgi:hypothetical protein
MGWKFWQKEDSGGTGKPKLRKPEELPSEVGRYMVVNLKLDPDWVWSLRCAVRDKEGVKGTRYIRIFDETRANELEISVKNYTTMDEHPELIIFEGEYVKGTNTVQIHKKVPMVDGAAPGVGAAIPA